MRYPSDSGDVVVKMPPVKEYTIQARIRKIIKAIPRPIVETDYHEIPPRRTT